MGRATMRCKLALLALPFVAACASASGDYPSLAIRDAERARGTIDAPQPEPTPPPAPKVVSADVLERIAAYRAEAVVAHRAFVNAAPAARRAVAAGAGAARASDAWAAAQVALADLESHRSLTAVPLADLDALYAEQATGFDPVAEVAEARDAVVALVVEQDAELANLRARIR